VRKGVVILGAGALLFACTIQTIYPYGSGPAAGTASQVVGAAGGILTTNDGTTLLIPPMALANDTTITIGLDPTAPPLTGAHALATPHVFGPEGQTFAIPVCVTLSFEPGLLPEGMTEQNVVLYTTLEDAGPYGPLLSLATSETEVTGMTNHFSSIVPAYGAALELDAGADADYCDGSDIDSGDAGM
jgi:ZU5 domain